MYYFTIELIFRLFPRGKELEPLEFCLSSNGVGKYRISCIGPLQIES